MEDSKVDANVVNGSEEVNISNMKKVGGAQVCGEGLPYAPVDWPNEGDIWAWKVGKRFDSAGNFYSDRYLILPIRLQPRNKSGLRFRSKVEVKKFLQSEFPDADIDAFFASFTWKVPVKSQPEKKATDAPASSPQKSPKNKKEAIVPKDTPNPHPRKWTKKKVGTFKDTTCPHPRKTTKREAVAPKDASSLHPRKFLKLEVTKGGNRKTQGKIGQKHVVEPGKRRRRSARIMGQFKTKYAGMLFDLTMESDDEIDS